MSAELERIVAALRRERAIDEFVAVERATRAVSLIEGPGAGLVLDEQRSVEVHVYRDLRRGRGEAQFAMTPGDSVSPLVRAAVGRAGSSVGPTWTLPAPSAPARVEVADSALREDLRGGAEAIARQLGEAAKSAGAIARAEIACRAERVTARTSRGARNGYDATLIELDACVRARAGGRSERLRVRARHRSQLHLNARMKEVARRLRDRPRARPLAPGRYDVVLTGDAIVVPGSAERYGWLQPLVVHADSRLERQGLSRHRPGSSIFAAGAASDAGGDPLTIKSDGTVAYGTQSRPFGDLGEPVRIWTLVERNVARDLALPMREAGLRNQRPNGGVANLVVGSGATRLEKLLAPAKRPLVRVVDLAWLHVDPQSGWCSAELGLGYADDRAVSGGVMRANLFELLAGTRLAKERFARDWYRGPAAIRFDDVELR